MFSEALDFVINAFTGAVDILSDLNTVAPILGIALVGYLILTAVTRLLLPILGGTLPSGMADNIKDSIDENKKYKEDVQRLYNQAKDLSTYDRDYMNRIDN